MSDVTNKPTTLRKGLLTILVFLILGVLIVDWWQTIVSLNERLENNMMRLAFEPDYSSLFKTPVNNVKFSDFLLDHGHNHFLVEATSGNLTLRDDGGFRSVDYKNTPFMPNDKPWIIRCYYQCHDQVLTGANHNVWVYADPIFSKAFVVVDDNYTDPPITGLDQLFEITFKNPKRRVNWLDCYERGKYTYFEIISPTCGAPVVVQNN